jgi:hypothetical protein
LLFLIWYSLDMTTSLTIKQGKQIVKALGGSLKKNEYDEYVIKFGKQEYFGGSLSDAIGTAYAITGKVVS